MNTHSLVDGKFSGNVHSIDMIDADDGMLSKMSEDYGLSLSLDEMKRIQNYFKGEGRNPSDIELQALGQAWSEHCCYKSSKKILKEFVFNIGSDRVLSRGDAGVMVFDDEYGYALRIESHNHPSAVEPYGGAATGIGGILRDVVCMGAQPIGLADPLCFGPIDRKGKLPEGIKHPRYLLDGVVSGIRDYGNRCGIPTITGGIFFDERYTGNCLVNVGCFGIVKRNDLLKNFAGGPGECMVLAGGNTGRDGIHGVNFASKDLSSSSNEESRGAVQLGDPIMKEPLIHACLEVNERKLITGMKDLGGGGLSCVIGEMALDAGCGAHVQIDKVPLKEVGLAPWEIWVSESQERMMCTCKPDKVDDVLKVFKFWDVPATVVATTTDGKRMVIESNGDMIFEMDLEFLTGGPMYSRPFTLPTVPSNDSKGIVDLPGNETIIPRLLSDLNVASKEWAIRQYDHEVRASTVIHPMVGRMNNAGPGDATVLRPLHDRWKGLAIAIGCNPWFTRLDPYNGGMSSIDEAIRNVVAVGATPDALTDCLNFGNPERPERLGELREAVRGIGDMARGLDLPIPSGNVSLYNETSDGSAILPTPMIAACGLIDDVRNGITADMKREGSRIYLVGDTKDEMGGSLLFRTYNGEGGQVPTVDIERLKTVMGRLLNAMGNGLVASCHDCSDGGLAVSVAEMCISGGIGARLDLETDDLCTCLYSESNSRWIVEVFEGHRSTFEGIMRDAATPIGTSGSDSLDIANDGTSIPLSTLRDSWNDPIWNIMGGE